VAQRHFGRIDPLPGLAGPDFRTDIQEQGKIQGFFAIALEIREFPAKFANS
jgi:hypothetical protein